MISVLLILLGILSIILGFWMVSVWVDVRNTPQVSGTITVTNRYLLQEFHLIFLSGMLSIIGGSLILRNSRAGWVLGNAVLGYHSLFYPGTLWKLICPEEMDPFRHLTDQRLIFIALILVIFIFNLCGLVYLNLRKIKHRFRVDHTAIWTSCLIILLLSLDRYLLQLKTPWYPNFSYLGLEFGKDFSHGSFQKKNIVVGRYNVDFDLSAKDLMEILKKIRIVRKKKLRADVYRLRWTNFKNPDKLELIDQDVEHMAPFKCFGKVIDKGEKSSLVIRYRPSITILVIVVLFSCLVLYNVIAGALLKENAAGFFPSILAPFILLGPIYLAWFFLYRSAAIDTRNEIVESIQERISTYELRDP